MSSPSRLPPSGQVHILAPPSSVLGAAMSAALIALDWRPGDDQQRAGQAPRVVLVENDDGSPWPGPGDDHPVAVGVGSVRTLAQLIPLVRRGAVALNQDAPFPELARTVSVVLQASVADDPALVRRRLAVLRARQREANALATLTAAERRVLRLLAAGVPASLIARRLSRTEHTVRSQIGAVLRKLDVSSQLVAVAVAQRSGPWDWQRQSIRFTDFGDDRAPRVEPR